MYYEMNHWWTLVDWALGHGHWHNNHPIKPKVEEFEKMVAWLPWYVDCSISNIARL